MDEEQSKFERTVGDAFVNWYNESTGTAFKFVGRAGKAPDLLYSDNSDELALEITSAYYDKKDAQFWWQNLRKSPNAPTGWGGEQMDEALLEDVSQRITKKCRNSYGENCALVVYVHPAMTLKEEVEELLHTIKLPDQHPFIGIYLTGHFPMSTRSWGGYQCWKLC